MAGNGGAINYKEREQYQGPPPAREVDFKEQAEDRGNNTSSRGSRR